MTKSEENVYELEETNKENNTHIMEDPEQREKFYLKK